MTQRIEGEGPEKVPPPGEKIPPVSEEIQISRVPPEEGVKKAEGVKAVQEGMGLPSPEEVSKVTTLDIDKISEQLVQDSKELQQLLEVALVDPQKAPSLNSWAEKNSEKLLEVAKTHAEAAENWGQFSGGIALIPGTVIGAAERYYELPVVKSITYLTDASETVTKLADGVADAKLVFKIPATLGKGANLIYKRTVLKMVEMEIQAEEEKLLEAPNEKRQMEIKELKAWLQVQNEFLFEEAETFGVETSTYVPKGVATGAKLFGKVTPKFLVATYGAIALFSIAATSYAVHVARKKRKTHAEWVERFKEKPIGEEPITSAIKIELEGGERKDYEVPVAPKEMVEAVNGLLVKRKKALETRMAMSAEEFDNWAIPMANSDKSFEEVKGEFKEKGVGLDELKAPIKSKEELSQALVSPEKKEVKKEMLQQYVEKKQTISVLIRNGLKNLAEKKLKVEKKFLNFKLTKSSISLTFSTIAFVATVVLKALAVASIIAIPTIAIGFTGLGAIAVGVALLLVGLFLLHYYRPNLFSQVIRGVHIRLALNNIPHSFHNFRLSLNKIKQLRKDLELSQMSAQAERLKALFEKREIREAKNIPKEVRPLLKDFKVSIGEMLKGREYDKLLEELERVQEEEKSKISEEQKKLDDKITEIEMSVKEWKDRITPLKQRLIHAGWKDFERAVNLAETAPKTVEGKEVPQETLGLLNVLVEGLLHDESYLDPSTRLLLREQLGIDLEKIRERSASDKKQIEEDLKEAFKTFFAMDDRALIRFIKQQKAKFDFGVLGGSTV